MPDVHKILIFLKRRPGMSVAEFRDYYENNHAPLCFKYMLKGARYQRRFIDPLVDPATGQADELPFDVITELWFDDRAVFDKMVAFSEKGVLPPDVLEDELKIFDRSKSRFTTVTERETENGWRAG